METSVVAAVRCRPVSLEEQRDLCKTSVEVSSDAKQVVVCERPYDFNYVYGPTATHNKIYDDIVHPVVEKVIGGLNACVLAYGQTGSGKTFTMGMNSKDSTHGIVHKSLQELFSYGGLNIKLSFLEVYKEQVHDLLCVGRKKMQVVDFKPVGLSIVSVSTIEHALNVMEEGLRNRRVGDTHVNLHSSRSHAVLTLYITGSSKEGPSHTSKLYLVDLAGSESVSLVTGDTRREGVMINKGLLQLGLVVSALSSGSDHIPYRNSALTSILKDTLCSNNMIVLIACISPLEVDTNDTNSTLKFAMRVGNIKLNPIIKQRVLNTPFKTPFKKNTTIATPGNRVAMQRPPLRPFNKTFDSPRTPQDRKRKRPLFPTSTPFEVGLNPLKWEPTPIPKTDTSSAQRRSSVEWNALDVSNSTVVDCAAQDQVKAPAVSNETSLFPNEMWLRSLIADVVKETLQSHTQAGITMMDDQPLPKQPRRSARLSSARLSAARVYCAFGENSDVTVVQNTIGDSDCQRTLKQSSFHSENKPCKRNESQQAVTVRRSVRLSIARERLSVASCHLEKSQASLLSEREQSDLQNSKTTQMPVRRSARLSVAMSPSKRSFQSDSPHNKLESKTGRKTAARRSTRLSKVEPALAQKSLNMNVLNILKFGNIKKMQSLPTIGPKTAVIINNHRILNGPIETLKDLENVQGLSRNFTKRFFWANNIVMLDDSATEI